jgi:hypothetical protein
MTSLFAEPSGHYPGTAPPKDWRNPKNTLTINPKTLATELVLTYR